MPKFHKKYIKNDKKHIFEHEILSYFKKHSTIRKNNLCNLFIIRNDLLITKTVLKTLGQCLYKT